MDPVKNLIEIKYELLCWRYETKNRIKASKIQKIIDKIDVKIKKYNKKCYETIKIVDYSEFEARLKYGFINPPRGGTGEIL